LKPQVESVDNIVARKGILYDATPGKSLPNIDAFTYADATLENGMEMKS